MKKLAATLFAVIFGGLLRPDTTVTNLHSCFGTIVVMQLGSLIVINRLQNSPYHWNSDSPPVDEVLGWKTCLRNILIANSETSLSDLDLLPSDKIYQSQNAYAFLLEVICGLHSQIFGETEVLGQFRERFAITPSWFMPVVESLLVDSKSLRQKFLQNLGNQSYGSFLRKTLPPSDNVVIIGSGNLTQSILPYLINPNRSVGVLSRNTKKTVGLLTKNKFEATVYDLKNDKPYGDFHLVVAAPVKASEIMQWTKACTRTVVDFRETCSSDPLSHPKLTTLIDFFSTQKEIIEKNQDLKITIKDYISTHLLTQQHRLSRPIFRPFGWEDLCG